MLDIVILAAGKGTRMRSATPKVLQTIAGLPMVSHVYQAASALPGNNAPPVIVVGHGGAEVKENFSSQTVQWAEQKQQLGTGHAVQAALPHLGESTTTLILYGDVPLIQPKTLQRLAAQCNGEQLTLLTVNLADPSGYGRIVREPSDNSIVAIVEEKDASDAQKKIAEINTGIMAVPTAKLRDWLPQLSNNNAQQEYYLTDIVAMAKRDGTTITSCQPQDLWEVEGVNNRQQQATLERQYQLNQANAYMQKGLMLLDPTRFDCRGSLIFGQDVCIDINVIIEGNVELGDGVTIGPNCIIKNATIAAGSRIEANSMIDNSQLDTHCTVGPFARLRPGSVLQAKAKVGNFVEIKKSVIGKGSKVNHLSYIGDCDMGTGVNIGAGTITCNYDGVNKFKTVIGNDCFVGSNTALVAPVELARDSCIGAGSTITKSTEAQDLAIARAKQRNLPGWQKPTKQ
ncbi:bifunctional UDP-N-acetylglucosamine diphosphorylase/glucosamine-1-phosphate N-acetyltransferase GlmU [Gilvimarinus agarilyticus]|uniref:bifunctional UDP-N-acetylglucosamine diphosphorylase/glucosamine-1-phosphate N-acetyltransferase GlmU n=1 Tax=Gilvimarinus sp. 2_MG-2023 TaxID=3062666 RepID=UPI001C0A36C6|nr:bifunctional UDP-N-acetylglucosamine diphosphorylase/glucosamine-1-phosphate N-acetyltransferase GlmU [Gilvimarinus sp. 2_MG-2023]MBU2884193.1 bifunctional UDP-N-acetylglucosamine diphosphorylase/glucosamine-1-phosphate N-acetyltransferase GlmU [Gilvimarinus agarilyticus]MDO6569332.1 bifunctional UDP-N-acetylglucosamine diphosphorylase/glucosamine-1-phosphate N-acetyltransferase GlmU [Gilvimarinus sp. 2_MG-2023]